MYFIYVFSYDICFYMVYLVASENDCGGLCTRQTAARATRCKKFSLDSDRQWPQILQQLRPTCSQLLSQGMKHWLHD
jgi:hypothetical protein